MKRAVLFILIALGLAASTHAQSSSAPRQVCAPTNSEAATVAAIAADPAAWIGRCVSVEAIYAGEQLHADADAVYGVNGSSIGGYVDGRGDIGGAWRGVFTGRVADCAQAEEDLLTGLLRSPGISLHGRTLGCLEANGPFLVFMSQGELKPAGIKRRLPGASGGGNLGMRTRGLGDEALVRQLAARFETALLEGDKAALAEILDSPYQAGLLLTREDTAFAAMRTGGPKKLQLFTYPAPNPVHLSRGEACWCLKADCTKLWPIHSRDADNQASRPYACIRVTGRREGETWRFRVDASQDVYGLDEP